jgi:hypothetical protein
MRISLIILLALALLVSCGQGTNKTGADSGQEVLSIEIEEFLADAAPLVGKTVNLSGTVVHVCRHGGQRMFLVGEDGEDRVRITTGEDIAEFNIDLEGEMIEITGIVRELIIDETYLAEWEAEVLEGSQHDRGEGHEGGVGHGDHHGDDAEEPTGEMEDDETADAEEKLKSQLEKIQSVRDEIAESGKEHLSDYWIESVEFKVTQE